MSLGNFFRELFRRAASPRSGKRGRVRRPSLRLETLEDRCVLSSLPNGVAAGDVTQTSAVLWTRSTNPGNVVFELAADPDFTKIVNTQTVRVTNLYLPVKVQVNDLAPGTAYYYRATDRGGTSESGRFRTPAAFGQYAGLRFGVAPDSHGGYSPFPALRNAAERNLDFMLEHGDTVYADQSTPALPTAATILIQFRVKHDEVYSGRYGANFWAPLRAAAPVLATIDDHEVANDFSGGAHPSTDPRFLPSTANFINETDYFRNGLQVFQEYNPLRNEFYADTGDPRTANKRKLYRSLAYGSDAAAFLLDMRSFRDAKIRSLTDPERDDPKAVAAWRQEAFTPGRTVLGQQQLDDLKQDLLAAHKSGVTWKLIMNSLPIQNHRIVADSYEGFAAERADLLGFIHKHQISNVVFVSADSHRLSVNNLTYQTDPKGKQIPVDAFEVVAPAVGQSPTGPSIVNEYVSRGHITPADRDYYRTLPREEKDAFVQALMDADFVRWGVDPVGLEGSGIEAYLLQGSYFAAHNQGWTEFDIDPETQVLTVTTYGIDAYTPAELEADPEEILSREPYIISQFVVYPRAGPARVENVIVNDGSAQRSRITSLTVTFSTAVALDAGAFELRRQDGSLIGLQVATSEVGGKTVAVLTFTGADIVGGSLADGNYTLTVRGDRIRDGLGRHLDGDDDGTPGGDRADTFFRLYGDADGDRDVDDRDLWRFLGTLGRRAGQRGFLGYLDFDADGDVDLLDSLAFLDRLGTHLDP